MKVIEIKTDNKLSKIFIGEKLKNIRNYLPDTKTVIITDSHVAKIYKDNFNGLPVIEIGLGEKNKTLETIHSIFENLIKFEVDRSSFILAIGGGIVCDVAGFAASVFMRGIRFGFVSTTLLSQVDASVGGKNGVNFSRFKNMVGVFNQPDFVICDAEMLRTLDEKEFRSGFAEIVKAGAIKNPSLFEFLEENWQKALNFDVEVLNKIIYDSVLIKSKVVEADEKEKGERRLLNFGHTFAHSIEKNTDMLHGEAVSIGMALAAKLSEKLGFFSEKDTKRIIDLLNKLGLPTHIDLNLTDIFEAMKQDKKREGDSMHLVLLNRIGDAFDYKITLKKLEELVNDLHSNF